MKIALIGPVHPYRGGIAHYTTLLAKKLQAANHSVQMISFRRQYPSWLYPGATDRDTSRQPITVAADYDLDPLYPWTWVRTVRKIAQGTPDLVIIQWWTTFWAPAFATITRLLRRKNIKVIYLIHNVMPHEARVWDRWLSGLALSAGSSFIVQADREANRLRALLPGAKIVTTPLPVYNMFAGNVTTREEARRVLNLPQDEPVVLFFGIVRPYKGLCYLLEAFQILNNRDCKAHLVIAGEFWEPVNEYRDRIDQLGITGCVHIHNRYIPNEEIPAFFGAADVFAAPYIDGTQSASAKLALGFSIPMVITNCIVDETLAHQEGVWRVNERDVQGLANAIMEALRGRKENQPRQAVDDWLQTVQVIETL